MTKTEATIFDDDELELGGAEMEVIIQPAGVSFMTINRSVLLKKDNLIRLRNIIANRILELKE